jgi:hypothetical protein
MVLLDFSKAFDRVNHHTLLDKLRNLEVPELIIDWIESFLADRYQRVKIGTHCSEWKSLNGGVPQGTKLGPLLFLILINNLETTCSCVKFVDDTTLFAGNTIQNSEHDTLQENLDTVKTWCIQNDMLLNADKSKSMVINFNEQPPRLLPLRLDKDHIDPVSDAKLLGVIINSSLTWETHINYISKKAGQK